MSTVPLQPTDLYGGAMRISLPEGFIDASTLRQIPDHQEVFVSSNASTSQDDSIIIELVERLEKESDKQAVLAHLDEILEINSPGYKFGADLDNREDSVIQIPSPTALQSSSAYLIVDSRQAQKWATTSSSKPMHLSLALAVIRLTSPTSTDILVTLNSGVDTQEHSLSSEEQAALAETLKRLATSIVASLEVRDWGLFGEE
ncbi:hypothetical protein BZA70DRAFT_275493 [Myxozyma melibiosi]|uniref:Mog1p/PsbP-like protein n=1 Tax=Myxozyma melibiosi TaxID=54550 RepID=A0ABR1F841_9ASCO